MKNDLHAIGYISTASFLFSQAIIDQILLVSRFNNSKSSITGVLLYCNGTFMQCVEGPKESVTRLMKVIGKDERHHGMIELFSTPIEEREFGKWASGYVHADIARFESLRLDEWLKPPSAATTRGHQLISTFWKNNMGRIQLPT